tara:strand:- start:353 stop:1156 length:804 start_codon:yes stop_codon:yes gene_type:complete
MKRSIIKLNRFLGRRGLLPSTISVYLRGVSADAIKNPVTWLEEEISQIQPLNTLLVKRSIAKAILMGIKGHSEEEVLAILPKIRGIKAKVRDGLTDKQLETYHQHANAKHEPVRTILLLLPQTGMRISPLCSLKYTNIEKVGNRTIFRILGKGGKHRVIPLNAQAVKYLNQYLDLYSNPKATYLFSGRKDFIRPDTIRKHTQRIARDVPSLQNLSPHTLRHTYATKAYKAGVDLKTLQMLLGHSDLQTTSRYIHPTIDDLFAGVDKL